MESRMSGQQFDRRNDSHRQAMVDVGIVLQRTYGAVYAAKFLREMNIPEPVIDRVVSLTAVRSPGYRAASAASSAS
jgi:hypothetical protein